MDIFEFKDGIDYACNKARELLAEHYQDSQSYMTKIPDDRFITIVFTDLLKENLTIQTTDTTQVLYNKEFIYIRDEEADTTQIIPMANVDSIIDKQVDYTEDDSDLPFTMGIDGDYHE